VVSSEAEFNYGDSPQNTQLNFLKQYFKTIDFAHPQRRLRDGLKTIVVKGGGSRVLTHFWRLPRYRSTTVRCQAKNPNKC
jgi:hypothetical protein